MAEVLDGAVLEVVFNEKFIINNILCEFYCVLKEIVFLRVILIKAYVLTNWNSINCLL